MHKEKIGTIDDHFTLNIDLAPTILAAAGLPTPVVMQGRDMATLYSGKELRRPWREDFFYEHPVHLRDDIIPASEALVQKDYKYVFWPNYDVEELFDLRNDKYELQNLINRTSYKDLLHRMRNRFNKLKVRALWSLSIFYTVYANFTSSFTALTEITFNHSIESIPAT